MSGSDKCNFDKFVDGLVQKYHKFQLLFRPYSCVSSIHAGVEVASKIVNDNGIKVETSKK